MVPFPFNLVEILYIYIDTFKKTSVLMVIYRICSHNETRFEYYFLMVSISASGFLLFENCCGEAAFGKVQ